MMLFVLTGGEMSIIKWVLRGLATILVVAAVVYPAADWMRVPMDDAARAALKQAGKADQFVHLSAGTIHVRVQGPADGPVVMLVHGLGTGGFAFHQWIKPLSDAGFRVIVPDLFGYGYSDRPAAVYDKTFLVGQLAELLNALDVAGPIHIVGTSMGGAIVTDFVAENPQRIRSVTLVAPAGLGQLEATKTAVSRLYMAPVIGDWLARVLGATISESGVARAFADTPAAAGIVEWMREQTTYRGFAEGQLSMFRNYNVQERFEAYDALGRSGLPVLAIWGTADATIPFAHSRVLLQRVPQARLEPMEGEPHGLPLRKAEALIALVRPFLEAQP
jgi:pimeloyl-ACP methyl ester carboxylesterase